MKNILKRIFWQIKRIRFVNELQDDNDRIIGIWIPSWEEPIPYSELTLTQQVWVDKMIKDAEKPSFFKDNYLGLITKK
jgi:hypothetical protein